jgi:CobQ-like glutamine amidotransferase family enzyme
MELKVLYFYPDLMNLYGSYANVALLKRHLEELGNKVSVELVSPGEDADLGSADFLFMGAGTERSQKAALMDFLRFQDDLLAAAGSGTVMLFAGTAMELLGTSITAPDGAVYGGVGLAEFTSVQGARRFVGDVYGFTGLYEPAVVGFMNKCSVISGVTSPLLERCVMGFGNEREGGPEGYHAGGVFASELTGPLLVKNPLMLGAVISAIYQKRGEPLPEEIPAYPYEENSYAVTAQQLKLRTEQH